MIPNIKYVGIASAWGASADWKFAAKLHTNDAGNPYKQYTFLNNFKSSDLSAGILFSLKGNSNVKKIKFNK